MRELAARPGRGVHFSRRETDEDGVKKIRRDGWRPGSDRLQLRPKSGDTHWQGEHLPSPSEFRRNDSSSEQNFGRKEHEIRTDHHAPP